MDATSRLNDLRDDFLATSTQSMPIAGMLFWAAIAVAGLFVKPFLLGYMVGFGSGMIFPLGLLIDWARGRRIQRARTENPVTQMFLQSLALVVLLWPLVILGAGLAHNGNLVVLGGAILMGIIWIPYGWAAADPVGLQHAVGRCVLCYAAFIFVPSPYKATAISVVVLLGYLYALVRMRRPQTDSPTALAGRFEVASEEAGEV